MNPLNYSVITILLINFLFVMIKPKLFFNGDSPKIFGARANKNEVIIPYYTVSTLIGMLVYILIAITKTR